LRKNWTNLIRAANPRHEIFFLWSYFQSENSRIFSQDTTVPGTSNLRPKQNSNIILRIIGSFGHFPPGFWKIVAQKKVDTFPANFSKNPRKTKKNWLFSLNAVHRAVFGWPALDHMRSSYMKHENTNRWAKEIFMNFLNFPGFLLDLNFSMEFVWNLLSIIFALWNIQGHIFPSFFIFWVKGDPRNPSNHFSMIFHNFLEILSFENAAMQKSTINSERQFWTAPNPNPAHVLIRSRYLFWSLDPQTVSSENQLNPREDCVAGSLFSLFVM
jgi:hypothetical protein